jgi:hypothetical protein
MTSIPVMTPVTTHRKTTIAREASNRHARNVIATGPAFCTENSTTMAHKRRIKKVAIGPPFSHPADR